MNRHPFSSAHVARGDPPLHRPRTWLATIAVCGALDVLVVWGAAMRGAQLVAVTDASVVVVLGTLGFQTITRAERPSGARLVIAGVLWPLTSLDEVLPPWGPSIAWALRGLPFVLLGWAVLRFGRPLLDRAERALVGVSVGLMAVGRTLATLLVSPRGPDPRLGVWWPATLADGRYATTGRLVDAGAGAVLAAGWLLAMARARRAAHRLGGQDAAPVMLFGASLAVACTALQTVAVLDPDAVGSRVLHNAFGILVSGFGIVALFRLGRRRRVVVDVPIRSAGAPNRGSVNDLLRDILADHSADLLYWCEETQELVDEGGSRRPADPLIESKDRFTRWIHDHRGRRLALLTGGGSLGSAVVEPLLLRILAIVAENVRTHQDLLGRLAELEATRTAESAALERVKESFHRRLHDGPQQTIAAVRIDLDGLRDTVISTDAKAAVADIERKLTLALTQMHGLDIHRDAAVARS